MNAPTGERYPVKASPYSSHSRIVEMCGDGRGRRVLDVGCARGHLGSLLLGKGWAVTGIEPDPDDAAVARNAGLEVVVAPAEQALSGLANRHDVIVFADVLEHMVDPAAVLSAAVPLLERGGRIIISMPNVAHLTTRLQLLFGSFTYTDRGILDRTHLRFYTRRTVRSLVEGCGLTVVRMTATPAPIEEVLPVLLRSRILRPILALGALAARIRPSLLGYQFIIVAERP